MSNYWQENKQARKAIEGLTQEGLEGNTFSDSSYDMDNQIEIGKKYVYFFGEVYKQDNGQAPKVIVGFALQMQPTEGDPVYQAITKGLEDWKSQKQRSIGRELGDIVDGELDVQIPIGLHTSQYPLVKFEGTDAVKLMQKAKKTATALQDSGIKLAEWYFQR
jgi:hypothetical protein